MPKKLEATPRAVAGAAIILLAVAVIGTACSIAPLVDRSAEWAADAVDAYCTELGATERDAFGALVRARAAPHDVQVTCAGDE